jgi:uncharacterized ion transporter superfamily protein YfcC
MGGVFLALAIAAGVVGGLTPGATFQAMTDGFASMSFAAMVVGVARGVFVVLDEGKVVPILVPLSDLRGLSRQVTVTATQFGPGILNQFMPTDGALIAVLTLAGVRFEQWLRFCLADLRPRLRLRAGRGGAGGVYEPSVTFGPGPWALAASGVGGLGARG